MYEFLTIGAQGALSVVYVGGVRLWCARVRQVRSSYEETQQVLEQPNLKTNSKII